VETKTKSVVQNVILFDGVCNLCNGAVNFIIDRDTDNLFKFASLQSTYGQQYLANNDLPADEFDSIVFQQGNKVFTRSTAALKIARKMSGLWPLCYGFIIVPRFLRDAIYNFIANNRYKFFGKRDQCRVPTPDLKEKFLG